MLYPLLFKSQYLEKIWGGTKLKTVLNKNIPSNNIGESWEISSVEDNISVVSNGFLKDNLLSEIIEVYLTDLMGTKVYEKFGNEFPLLIKFIDANDDLSVQVHPPDEIAKQRHHAYGKTEMWYILYAEPNSYIYSGFNKNITKEEFLKHLDNGTVEDILNKIPAQKGDVFFIPSGRIHAIGRGILLAEIQQTSDITYRVFDWNRKDKNGNFRELHIEEALDVIDFNKTENPKILYQSTLNKPVELVSCQYFTTLLYKINKPIELEYEWNDSFKILIFIEGNGFILHKDTIIKYKKGQVFLIPAELDSIIIQPSVTSEFLEVFIR